MYPYTYKYVVQCPSICRFYGCVSILYKGAGIHARCELTTLLDYYLILPSINGSEHG
uniref:Uncharacterized protein n=1 Tax=Arundo donax TaxID=35708 RepID=A0A0A9ASI8_ARUDO